MCGLENLWRDPRVAEKARRFYLKCIISSIRILIIYIICRYFFVIPKPLELNKS